VPKIKRDTGQYNIAAKP